MLASQTHNSPIFVLDLAEVGNHPMKLCCLQKLSTISRSTVASSMSHWNRSHLGMIYTQEEQMLRWITFINMYLRRLFNDNRLFPFKLTLFARSRTGTGCSVDSITFEFTSSSHWEETCAHTHTHTHAMITHTRTHMIAHTHTHAHMITHTHTHTEQR